MKRLLLQVSDIASAPNDIELDKKVNALVDDFAVFMGDDFSTPKVLANMFELVPIINGIKDKHTAVAALSNSTLIHLQRSLKTYLEDIFGLVAPSAANTAVLDGVLQLLIEVRSQAKASKDFVTSDKIRNQLMALGIQLKDEKDGSVSYSVSN
jgi:cysteinyl-tRNA synthetase